MKRALLTTILVTLSVLPPPPNLEVIVALSSYFHLTELHIFLFQKNTIGDNLPPLGYRQTSRSTFFEIYKSAFLK